MKVIGTVYLLIIASTIGLGQALQQQSYEADDSNFANPERGYYSHTEVHSPSYVLLNETSLRALRTDQSITQILRVFYLEDYRTKPISQSYINNMRRDFNAVRNAGLKIIIRFAYSTGTSAPFNDATPDVVLMHIDQLKQVLRENADVIATMQAGFIGTWGEWHFTDHFAQSPGNISEDDWVNRKKVVDALLNALPTSRTVQIRTPGYKMILYDTEIPLAASEAFSGIDQSRVGHHNDCFVASFNDFGTYLNPTVEKPYLETETTYLPMGGETCALAAPYSDCENSTDELERFHWSYLNTDYNRSVLNEWDNQGCLEEVELRLGYRHKLISAEMNEVGKPNGSLILNVVLNNEGYANFYNERFLHVILKNDDSGVEYFYTVESDPRLWPIGTDHNIEMSVGIPETLANGTYSVYLSLPDADKGLSSRPEYAVRLANQNLWHSDLGYNDLGMNVQISTDNTSLPDYEGTDFFRSASSIETLELEGSDILEMTADDQAITTYFPTYSDQMDRLIERAVQDGEFEFLANIKGNISYYTDLHVAPETTYQYRYKLVQENAETPYSQTVTAELTDPIIRSIIVDGESDDWNGLPPSLTTFNENFKTLRTYFGLNTAYFHLKNTVDYKIYIDADNSLSSGVLEEDSPIRGMDYLVENSKVYSYLNGSWTESGTINESTSDGTIELGISFDQLVLIESNTSIGMYALLDANVLSNAEEQRITHYRVLPPDTPVLTSVEKDALNETALVINWESCSTCTGYILERSENGTDFLEAGDFDRDDLDLRDRNLDQSKSYSYRLKSYNELGASAYSNVLSGTPGSVLAIGVEDQLIIYPNPVRSTVSFNGEFQTLQIVALNGQVIEKHNDVSALSLNKLKSGVYILRGEINGTHISKRIIKISN